MLIRYGYHLEFECPQAVTMLCLLDAHPDMRPRVRWQSPFRASPQLPSDVYIDSFGNAVRRLVAPAGPLTLSRDAIYESDSAPDPVVPDAPQVPIEDLPSAYLVYLLGSRYCETDRLSQIAWDLFGTTAPGWARVQAICDFVHQHLSFSYAYARADRTAFDAFQERQGVCRDFAHLAVAFCRCMNIPARYANGFLGDIGVPRDPSPMDYNAWIEVYLGHKWYIFDPRHNMPRVGRITVARGRDATDIPLTTTFGQHVLKLFKVWTDEVTDEDLRMMKRQAA